jgi:TatD DNase family protein
MSQNPEWIDSHCHLEMLKGEPKQILEKCFHQDVGTCVTIGTNHSSNQQILQYCKDFSQVYATLGIHPHEAASFQDEHLDWIRKEANNNKKIIGIGECGFDLYYERSPETDQKNAFVAQLDLAVELALPVVIHSREADSITRDVIDGYKQKQLTGVVHCFTSDIDQARYMLDAGFYLSFNGICTYPTAESVREVLKFTPLDRILLETDAPFLSPQTKRGKPNNPGNVSIVGKFIANYLNIPSDEFAGLTANNTHNLFPRISNES